MLTALVLVCSLAATPDLADCNKESATDVLRVPEEFSSPVTCFMHGQAYLAQTELGRDLAKDYQVKVVCVASANVERTISSLLAGSAFAASQCPAGNNDEHGIDVQRHSAFGEVSNQHPGGCTARKKNGFPVPDPSCTPGAFNPTVTVEILRDSTYRMECARDKVTRPVEKVKTYAWYGVEHTSNNQGADQVCELDYLVPLELGGADTLDNIWPHCGPSEEQKDLVETYLSAMVMANKADLDGARKCIASDWTQFLEQARQVCDGTRCNVIGEAQLDLGGC